MVTAHRSAAALAVLVFSTFGAAQTPTKAEYVFLRPTGKEFVWECTFSLEPVQEGLSILSVTGRGKDRMEVRALYDSGHQPRKASATWLQANEKRTCALEAAEGKVTVTRPGAEPQSFAVAGPAIVTTAPDWSDLFLLCRRYNRKQGGKQTMTGLWIHPIQQAQKLTFTVERQGQDVVSKDGTKLTLDRFLIHIRGPNPYLAWADADGVLVKIQPLPYKEGASNWLVRQGWEGAAASLMPRRAVPSASGESVDRSRPRVVTANAGTKRTSAARDVAVPR